MRAAILDTNVYIDHWERDLRATKLDAIRRMFVVRQSAVVLSELRRGARTRKAQRLVEALHRLAAVIWEPSPADWWDAGRLIQKIGDARGWETSKRRDFQNDALIALTARRHGAAVVTSNRCDFELLEAELGVEILGLDTISE